MQNLVVWQNYLTFTVFLGSKKAGDPLKIVKDSHS